MFRRIALLLLLVMLPLLAPAQAQAVTSVTSTMAGVTVTLQFDQPVSAAEAQQLQASSAQGYVYCNHTFVDTDSNGRYTVQRACNGTTAPWSYKFSSALQAIVVGTVNEHGMDWTRNGITQPRQAPHPAVPPSYTFHGTYSGLAAGGGTTVTFSDVFTFRHNIAGGGNATLTIGGNLYFSNAPYVECSPGNPCRPA